jgi:hypothetical protein
LAYQTGDKSKQGLNLISLLGVAGESEEGLKTGNQTDICQSQFVFHQVGLAFNQSIKVHKLLYPFSNEFLQLSEIHNVRALCKDRVQYGLYLGVDLV